MKFTNWIRFTWELSNFAPIAAELPEHYEIAPATAEDEIELRQVMSRAFVLDPTWNPSMQEVMQTIEVWLDKAFAAENVVRLALRHGSRIIGASILSLEPESENHLSPGPCVSMEYRNRGFGTHLLARSLATLREAGLAQATGVTKENAPVAKFLYPKFNGVGTPHDFSPLLAA